MIQGLLETLKLLNDKQEFWDSLAKTYKNSYDALIRAGFTPDQAR